MPRQQAKFTMKECGITLKDLDAAIKKVWMENTNITPEGFDDLMKSGRTKMHDSACLDAFVSGTDPHTEYVLKVCKLIINTFGEYK